MELLKFSQEFSEYETDDLIDESAICLDKNLYLKTQPPVTNFIYHRNGLTYIFSFFF